MQKNQKTLWARAFLDLAGDSALGCKSAQIAQRAKRAEETSKPRYERSEYNNSNPQRTPQKKQTPRRTDTPRHRNVQKLGTKKTFRKKHPFSTDTRYHSKKVKTGSAGDTLFW